MKQRTTYSAIATGGAIGLIASFLEVVEYQQVLKNAHTTLTCDLNSVFNCSPVLTAWQGKLFGFPNAMLCMIFFTLMLGTALAGLTGGTLVRKFRLSLQGIALFFLGFALWFFWESIYRIGALCILCIFCLFGLLLLNWGWMRINAADLPIGAKARSVVQRGIKTGADTFVWIVLGMVVAFAMLLRFY